MASKPRTTSVLGSLAISQKLRNVWMFSYEYAGIAQAGGLGEAVTGLARTLASDFDLNVTVFLPAHGRHLDPNIANQFNLHEISTFAASGYRRGMNGVHYNFLSGAERGVDQKVNLVLVKGIDDPTSHWLDDPVLYDHELTFEKMSLFARTVITYSQYLLAMGKKLELPDLIHANDWHMVPAGVAVKQCFQETGLKIPLLFTIHLLSQTTLPWHYASEDWTGIRNLKHLVRTTADSSVSLTYQQVWEDNASSSIEKFGAIEADYITSVSQSYLTSDVRDYIGDTIVLKSGHIYNGCDWDYERIRSSAMSKAVMGRLQTDEGSERWELRKSLLLKGLAALDPSAETGDPSSNTKVRNGSRGFVFQNDGPLVLMTGRLSPQKGADLLLDAVPMVIEEVPDAKFLLFLLPSGDPGQVDEAATKAAAHPGSVRLFFGRHPSIYLQAHVSADVYAMPSRSEPFGISALEAMVTGNPVVGSNVGGISETVLDLTRYGQKGTGMLVPPDNVEKLARSLVSLLLLIKTSELHAKGESDPGSLADQIPIQPISDMVKKNPLLGSQIRMNCRNRVEQNFRWKNAGKIALERYAAAQLVAGKDIPRPS